MCIAELKARMDPGGYFLSDYITWFLPCVHILAYDPFVAEVRWEIESQRSQSLREYADLTGLLCPDEVV